MNAGVFLRIKKYFAIFLVGVVGLLMLNNALFMHLHTLPNGKIVAHAHPFSANSHTDGSGCPIQHQHSKVEFHFLDSLMLLILVGLATNLISVLAAKETHFCSFVLLLLNGSPQQLTNKAPPVLV